MGNIGPNRVREACILGRRNGAGSRRFGGVMLSDNLYCEYIGKSDDMFKSSEKLGLDPSATLYVRDSLQLSTCIVGGKT